MKRTIIIERISPDGVASTHTPKGDRWTLAELQALVGGYIVPIYLPGGRVALVDEDGQPRRLAPNLAASALVGRVIVGPVVIGPVGILQ